MPRLRSKTSPKQVEAEQVGFEEEVARYKRDIARDIQQLKQQAYKEPAWITKILDRDEKNDKQARQTPSSSSSRWEQPITDTQAVEISKFIMTSAEEQAFFDGEGCDTSSQNQSSEANQDSEEAPSWERYWNLGRQDPQQQDTQVVDSFDWEAWLA